MSITIKRIWSEKTGKLLEAIGRCHCGTLLDMIYERDCYDTIECPCGRLYNSSGQELRPRSQWEEPLEEAY